MTRQHAKKQPANRTAAGRDYDAEIEAALADGRLTPGVLEEYARGLARSQPAELERLLQSLPVCSALGELRASQRLQQAAAQSGETSTLANALRDAANGLTSELNAHSLKLSMFRTAVDAFLQAALHNEVDREASPLDMVDMMKVLSSICPSEDFYDGALTRMVSALRRAMPEVYAAAEGYAAPAKASQGVVTMPPAALLVEALQAASGAQSDPVRIMAIADQLFDYTEDGFIDVCIAFHQAMLRRGMVFEVTAERSGKRCRYVLPKPKTGKRNKSEAATA